jgi:hypothetical protein
MQSFGSARRRKFSAQRDILRKRCDDYMFSGMPSTADGSQTCRLFRFGPRLCENSEVQFARGNSVSIFVDLKTNNAGTYRREKTIEKTILRILGPCTFSHSLDPKRTKQTPGASYSGLSCENRKLQ